MDLPPTGAFGSLLQISAILSSRRQGALQVRFWTKGNINAHNLLTSLSFTIACHWILRARLKALFFILEYCHLIPYFFD